MKTKEKILIAAKNYLLKNGQAGFTVRSIAAEAEVNQGLIHHYFGSKENLILELIHYVATAPFEEAKRQVVKMPKKEVKDVLLKIFIQNSELVKLIMEFVNLARHSEQIRKKMQNIMMERREFMTNILGIEDNDEKVLFIAGIFGIIFVSQIDDSVNVEGAVKKLFSKFGII
ncbi:TetR/AcrR family transcriptional regulator [bacterium]|nr:TetR/AcrR family transcriptional regulator [bacterium]